MDDRGNAKLDSDEDQMMKYRHKIAPQQRMEQENPAEKARTGKRELENNETNVERRD